MDHRNCLGLDSAALREDVASWNRIISVAGPISRAFCIGGQWSVVLRAPLPAPNGEPGRGAVSQAPRPDDLNYGASAGLHL